MRLHGDELYASGYTGRPGPRGRTRIRAGPPGPTSSSTSTTTRRSARRATRRSWSSGCPEADENGARDRSDRGEVIRDDSCPHEVDPRYSGPGASELPWTQVDQTLAAAEIYWLTTVRDDGRPHVCPLVGLWFDGRGWFTTGAEEQKARNLAANAQVALTTGTNTWAAGLDVVVEGSARRATSPEDLERAAAAYVEKYGEAWRFTVEGEGLSAPEAGRRDSSWSSRPRCSRSARTRTRRRRTCSSRCVRPPTGEPGHGYSPVGCTA